jgi:hypothetical protein
MKCFLRISAFVLPLLINSVQSTTASDKDGYFTVVGRGISSCGSFLRRTQVDDIAFGAWLGGFLTARNQDMPGVDNLLRDTDYYGGIAWIENYYRQNPVDTFSHAAQALVDYLYSRQR